MSKKILLKIEQLAAKTAEQASREDVKLGEKVEALKVLLAFYSLARKGKPDESDDETTMAVLQDELRKAETNGSEIQHRTGRRTRV